MADVQIDPDALYTVEQCARKLMQVKPQLTFDEAYRLVCDAIDKGELKPSAYLARAFIVTNDQ